ncbi:hypothetical protein K503DRAFT_288209 [Rhizopogon vinicolor AM-OR11-026]|uniref:Uncharacterized protein n=1 Tax=Rhizopogon vinicolor AM-OR11-026 TaxID=1314800 RepID=A0A1B7MVJ7_9AGAM|nr:hypothetical protein K503DRAFT_288209 [Rhizopogon vinicolor AM-OR11-026]
MQFCPCADFCNFRYEFNGRQLKVHYDKFSPSAHSVPLVGVPPHPSTLSQYESHLQSLQLESQQPGRRQYEHSFQKLDVLSHSQLDPLRRGDLDSLTSSQLEALLIRANTLSGSQSSNASLSSSPPTSASLTTPSPLHTQSLVPTTVHSLAPTPTHSHSLTSSPHLGFANTSSTSFASLSLPQPLGTDTHNMKLHSHSGVGKNGDSLSLKLKTDTTLGSDLHLLSSKNTSRASSFSSPRPTISAGSSQAQSYTTTSSGSSRPSFSTPSSLTDDMHFSQQASFSASQSQRSSFNSSVSQRPSFGGGSAQRPTLTATSLLQGPFFDDEREVQGSISQPVSLGTSRANSGSSAGASSLPSTLIRPTSGVGRETTLTSPPASGGWPSMSSPRPTSPRSATLAHPILSSDSSSKSQSVWGASSKVGSSQGFTPAKAEGLGNADAVATALGSLGMRRSKAQAHKAAEKEKVSSSDPKSTSPSPQKLTSPQKPSQSSSRRQPGPISLPPPSTFTLQHPLMLSPHHPQSPMYHAGYAPSHPASPLYHPVMNSPVHHPAMSPLHHPSMHPYHHHLHYSVMTPHGLPPITPSMPPFTFQSQQTANGRANITERPGSNEGSRQGEGRSEAPPPSSPYHHPLHSQVQYTSHLPPHMFSPGIPLSPGIMMPISPGYPSSVAMVPLTPGGVPLPMTPGVTMTPGAFWPQAPWINPAPGAPVHADDHGHSYPQNSGGDYFPPQSEPDDETGYFPPVSSLANEIFKEGSEFHSDAREEESHSRSSSVCTGMVSITSESMQEARAHGITRTTSVHNNGKGSGTPKRASLTHRPDSDPIVPSLLSSGERQS